MKRLAGEASHGNVKCAFGAAAVTKCLPLPGLASGRERSGEARCNGGERAGKTLNI